MQVGLGTYSGLREDRVVSTTTHDPVYQNTIVFALSNQKIADMANEYQKLPLHKKAYIGFRQGLLHLSSAASLVLVVVVARQILKIPEAPSPIKSFTLRERVQGVILEEFIFRSLQNSLAFLQKTTIKGYPHWQTNRIIKWLTSPSARVFAVTTLFSLCHLRNEGWYLNKSRAITQTLLMALLPSFSILHETTGNFVAPFACHFTNNFILDVPDWISPVFNVFKK